MSSKQLFLGVTLGRRKDWENYFAEPIATKSTKPESVAKEIERKREYREAQAHFYPVAGTVQSCVVLDQWGETIYEAVGGFDAVSGEISYNALSLIDELMRESGYDKNKSNRIFLFGLRIRDRLRIMALDALYFVHHNPGDKRLVNPDLWFNRPFDPVAWGDPYESVIPSEHRNNIPYDGLCDFLNIDLAPNANLDTDARNQAEIARQITIKTGLI